MQKYDIIIVGAGHAGCEAAAAATTKGADTLLITIDMEKIAQMSCNPAVGGIAKGQIVREIDALGGQMGTITDKSSIHFRMLNRSKGAAMWSPRAQCDRMKFSSNWRAFLETLPSLHFWQGNVSKLLFNKEKIAGVETSIGTQFHADAVILTVGTFLNGLMHIGRNQMIGGRIAEPKATGITEQLTEMGFSAGRMKTGTPPRIDGRTINFSFLEEQKGDKQGHFSFDPPGQNPLKQRSCWITHTNLKAHDILRKGFEDSPLFNGIIQSIGPRYCPSIETKLDTFPDKETHQLFLEPEGAETIEYYLNGFSSSLPWNIQYEALRQIRGLEQARFFRPGYAIEYDFFHPTQLHHTLETKPIENLFFAGQINGTTGYEEAAAQGLIAGINASLKIEGKKEFTLARDQAYIGVLIDDLVLKGVDEPYRMFTSRAEHRILLRQDNADERLTPMGKKLGLIPENRYRKFQTKQKECQKLIAYIKKLGVKPDEINQYLENRHTEKIKQQIKLDTLVRRPQVALNDIFELLPALKEELKSMKTDKEELLETTEIFLKYQGYVDRERQLSEKMKRLSRLKIPDKMDYHSITSLSTEARQKLAAIRPKNLAQANAIPGVSPADISILLIYLKR